ncbi:hypothetical protein [Cohnella rhizosphaerae]|uniref:Uncharacterized protein n=1 Tax=Cohnella rhizosphaerae TaxID=1457232 RepID=A0A9X4KYH7_9BACL|nr:hypothetical protein [Cohnella rhizosphaerae]MDG0813108.1 hypothetical protein [Cohnella rhizosphaerae]
MRHWWSGFALIAAGVCVIVLLSLIQPARTDRSRSGQEGLFAPIRSERLVDEGIVDLIDPLPLANALSRVRWEPGILNVDLKVSPGAGGKESIAGGYLRIVQGFVRTREQCQAVVDPYLFDRRGAQGIARFGRSQGFGLDGAERIHFVRRRPG